MKKLNHNLIRDHSPPIKKSIYRITLKPKHMKTIKFFIIVSLLTFSFSNAQINKGNWMVGGSGSFYANDVKNESNLKIGSSRGLIINPEIGYFIKDKFAIGTQLGFTYNNPTGENNNSSGLSFGPMVRYYILNRDKPFNILTQLSYNLSVGNSQTGGRNNSNGYNIKAGPVIYFNNSVGLEFAVNYYNSKNNINYVYSGFNLSLGFQIHLEK